MPADPIPDDSDIARYAGPSKIDDNGRISRAAFRLRSPREEYLSVFCLDMIEGDDVSSRIEYLKKDMPLAPNPNGKLGVINVGHMKEHVESESRRKLSVTHEPKANPEKPELDRDYHCGVRGLRYDDKIIAELIAECVEECYPAFIGKRA